ncbi:MAG: hypothetical protein Ct9H300mP31_07260 [Acidimicrobiaceae bacterium]|nr:MAG: hypothetical protein Ct9H300mP31_07260 [Acidimicrobiaceae bacterium]
MTGTSQNGGRLLVDCLLAQGVDTAFGVPGESYLAVLDAFTTSGTASGSWPVATKAARPTCPKLGPGLPDEPASAS